MKQIAMITSCVLKTVMRHRQVRAVWARAGAILATALLVAACQLGDADLEWQISAVDPDLDLIVQYIARLPRIDFVPGASDPTTEGWPVDGQPVTWEAHVRNRGAGAVNTDYLWFLGGIPIGMGRVTIPADGTATVAIPRAWTRRRQQLQLILDPANTIPELEEANNSLTVFTDALSVGLWVEQGLYDYFDQHQQDLHAGSNSWEDWAQRQARIWNEMFATAIYSETLTGVRDRLRIDAIHLVPDGALPLAGGRPTNDPDASDHSVDLMWGFPTALRGGTFYANTTSATRDNPFYYEYSLLHELGHARYLVDVYGFDVKLRPDNRSTTAITECGKPLFGSTYLPVTGDSVRATRERGLMNGQTVREYLFVDRYSAVALNQIAGQRARQGNRNAPGDIGVFMNDLSQEYRLTVRDAATGDPLAGARIDLFRATPVAGSTGSEFYKRDFDNVPDYELFADASGAGLIGHCPFTFDTACTLVHGHEGSNTVILIRVEHDGQTGYGFLDITDFNLEYWRGHTELGEVTLDVHLHSSCSRVDQGCSDGGREGLFASPEIAACGGQWSGAQSLRSRPTGAACGDDLGVVCPAPADLCADRWHLCGMNGQLGDVRSRVTPEACAVEGGFGQFVAAVSHTYQNIDGNCSLAPGAPAEVHDCFNGGWGSEPLCCGNGCFLGACTDAVWPGRTRIGGGFFEGCGQFSSTVADGVLCCRD